MRILALEKVKQVKLATIKAKTMNAVEGLSQAVSLGAESHKVNGGLTC